MNKLFLLFFAFTIYTGAQGANETLFNSSFEKSFYAEPVMIFSGIDTESGMYLGARGGIILNHIYSVGCAYYGLLSNITQKDGSYTRTISTGYGGLFLQYIGNSEKMFHYNANLLLGKGGINYVEIDRGDSFFVLQPEIEGVLNISEMVRLNVGIGYKMTFGANFGEGSNKIDNGGLSGFTTTLGISLGKF